MKTKKNLFALLFALVLMLMCALPVMAAADAAPDGGTAQVELEVVNGDADADTDTPVVISNTDVELPEVLEGEAVEENYDEVAPRVEQQEARKSNNTPYFIGAAIAVLVFIGVALYCRVNGNK